MQVAWDCALQLVAIRDLAFHLNDLLFLSIFWKLLELKINSLEFLSIEGNIFVSRLETHPLRSDIFSLVSVAEAVS